MDDGITTSLELITKFGIWLVVMVILGPVVLGSVKTALVAGELLSFRDEVMGQIDRIYGGQLFETTQVIIPADTRVRFTQNQLILNMSEFGDGKLGLTIPYTVPIDRIVISNCLGTGGNETSIASYDSDRVFILNSYRTYHIEQDPIPSGPIEISMECIVVDDSFLNRVSGYALDWSW